MRGDGGLQVGCVCAHASQGTQARCEEISAPSFQVSKDLLGSACRLKPRVAIWAAFTSSHAAQRDEAQRPQSIAVVACRSLGSLQAAPVRALPGTGPPARLHGYLVFPPEGSRGMERTVVMDKSKGEPVISVKTTSRSKERVSIASGTSSPTDYDGGLMTTWNI